MNTISFNSFQVIFNQTIFFDVDAHGGLYTLIASQIIGFQGKVISFEPNPLNLHYLNKNIRINSLNNVLVVPKVVSSKSNKMALFYNKNNTALTSVYMEREKMITIETTAIDDIDMPSYFDIIKIIKVDTEGHDFFT